VRVVVLDVRAPCMAIRGGADSTVALARAGRVGSAALGTCSPIGDIAIG
jgi:hypothetical protein